MEETGLRRWRAVEAYERCAAQKGNGECITVLAERLAALYTEELEEVLAAIGGANGSGRQGGRLDYSEIY